MVRLVKFFLSFSSQSRRSEFFCFGYGLLFTKQKIHLVSSLYVWMCSIIDSWFLSNYHDVRDQYRIGDGRWQTKANKTKRLRRSGTLVCSMSSNRYISFITHRIESISHSAIYSIAPVPRYRMRSCVSSHPSYFDFRYRYFGVVSRRW